MDEILDPEPGGRELVAAQGCRQPEVVMTMLALLLTSMS